MLKLGKLADYGTMIVTVLAADPDMLRVRPVNPVSFWDDLARALDANPDVAPKAQCRSSGRATARRPHG